MNIPFFDLKKQYKQHKKEIDTAIQNVCRTASFSGGSFVEAFEQSFARLCNVRFVSGVDSGTSALQLALLTLNIGPGDEVIVPALTFIATASAVSHTGATPVFVDIDPETWEIDPQKIEKAITKKTKVIIGVHLYGQPFDIDAVIKIARKHTLFVIEDAAQAHGATYKNKPIGGLCDIGCFSFYPGKNLGAYGEGGAVTTNSKQYDDRIKRLRNHGSDIKYSHNEIGFNMRMDGIQGAVLKTKMNYLKSWNVRRTTIARMYRKLITNPLIHMQQQPAWAHSSNHLFVITVPDQKHFQSYLSKRGIETALHYPIPVHLQKAYSKLNYKKGDLPHAEYVAHHCVSLPLYPELPLTDVKKICRCINMYTHPTI